MFFFVELVICEHVIATSRPKLNLLLVIDCILIQSILDWSTAGFMDYKGDWMPRPGLRQDCRCQCVSENCFNILRLKLRSS